MRTPSCSSLIQIPTINCDIFQAERTVLIASEGTVETSRFGLILQGENSKVMMRLCFFGAFISNIYYT